MTPEDWSGTPPVFPDHPIAEIQLTLGTHPPAAPRNPEPPRDPFYIPPERCNPGHHQRPERFEFDDSLFVETDRREAWSGFGSAMSTLTMNWNSAVPLVNAFNDAQNDPSLQSDAMGLQTLGPGFIGDVGGMVEGQRVPPASGSSRTVGSLFNNVESDGITVMGTDLANRPADTSLDRMANDPRVRDARAVAVAADGDITTQLLVVKGKAERIKGAAARLNTAQTRARLLDARAQEAGAQADLTRLEAAKKATADNAKKITDLLAKVIMSESPAKAGEAILEEGLKETFNLIASEIIDARYADQIGAAKARLTAASNQVKELAQAEVRSEIEAAQSDLSAANTEFDAERARLSPLLVRRRSAYEQLGRALGSSSGAPPGVRRQVQAIITAIPLVETVVSRANNVVATVGELPYTTSSGVGLAMARYARMPVGDQFLSSVASYKGLKLDFVGRQQFWQARLESLRGVMRRLSGLHAPVGSAP